MRSWEQLPEGQILARSLDARLRAGVIESRARFACGDLEHFARLLPVTEHWRLLPHLLEEACFLDVEAGAEQGEGGELSVVGIMDREGPRAFVRGRDLDDFYRRSERWRCLVTFNGLAYDVPALRRAFPGWEPPLAHVDLRFLCSRVGLRGGLKQVERTLGFLRPPHLAALRGEDAIWLWHAWRRGDPAALRRLVEYNLYDVFHLRPLAELAYNRALRRTGMPAPELPVTERGALLYDVSRAVERACLPFSPEGAC